MLCVLLIFLKVIIITHKMKTTINRLTDCILIWLHVGLTKECWTVCSGFRWKRLVMRTWLRLDYPCGMANNMQVRSQRWHLTCFRLAAVLPSSICHKSPWDYVLAFTQVNDFDLQFLAKYTFWSTYQWSMTHTVYTEAAYFGLNWLIALYSYCCWTQSKSAFIFSS